METLQNCPVCGNASFKKYLDCKDYTVSQNTFTIVDCEQCHFKFTNPRPNTHSLGDYYKSEEYVSHSGTKKGIVNKLYHIVRSYTLIKKVQLVSIALRRKNNVSILDYGCGTGEFLNTCKNAKWDTTGIEPGDDARKFATEQYQLSVLKPEEFDTLNKQFDVITLWHVLEHIPNLNEIILKLKTKLKPGGVLIIAVPNCDSYDAKYYKEFWAAYDLPRHLYHFTPNDIAKLFEKHNLKVKTIKPMVFDSFYVSMLSEKYKTGKNNLLKAIFIGFLSNLKAINSGKKYSSQIYIIN